MGEESRKGWAWPVNSHKAHYFDNGRSLCGKWMWLGALDGDRDVDHPDNCATCNRKRKCQLMFQETKT